MNRHHSVLRIVLLVLIIILALVALFSIVKVVTTLTAPTDDTDTPIVSKTIVRDGVEYFPRQDITVFMLMGIDREGAVEKSPSYTNTGEADMVAVAVFDETAKSYRVLLLNRDTMLEMPTLGVDGKYAGDAYAQLALAHTYGSGVKDSCENITKTVSDLLYGTDIDYYMSMNMDTVAIMTDALGGVKVNVTDDFSAVDETIPMGETLLSGAQAYNFVRNRKDVGDEMNTSRMQRHSEFMNGFMSALSTKLKTDDSFVIKTYNDISPYVVSNCAVDTLSTMLGRYSDYTFEGVVIPEGESVKGERYMEFHLDEKALDSLVLDMFYSEKKF